MFVENTAVAYWVYRPHSGWIIISEDVITIENSVKVVMNPAHVDLEETVLYISTFVREV